MMTTVYFAFMYCTRELNRKNATVEKLRLCTGKEFHVCENGFKEFLQRMVSIEVDQEKLNKRELKALDMMKEYLKPEVKQENQGTFSDQINAIAKK